MKKIIKFIKSIFNSDKHPCYTDYINKENMICGVIINQVILANTYRDDYTFSLIPTKHYITIKCQTYNNIYDSMVLSLAHCHVFSREQLTDYIDTQLNALIKNVNKSLRCYKKNKYEEYN